MAKVELVDPSELQQDPGEDDSGLDLPDFDAGPVEAPPGNAVSDDNGAGTDLDVPDLDFDIREKAEDKKAVSAKSEPAQAAVAMKKKPVPPKRSSASDIDLRKAMKIDEGHEELLFSDLSYGLEKLKNKILQVKQLENNVEKLSFRLRQKDAEILAMEDEKKQLIANMNADRLEDKRKLKEFEATLYKMKRLLMDKDKAMVAMQNMAGQYKREAALKDAKIQELASLLKKKKQIAKDVDLFTRKVIQKKLSELQKSKDESYSKIELLSAKLQDLDAKLKDRDSLLKNRDLELFKIANERKIASEKMIKRIMEAHTAEKAELNLEIEKLKNIIQKQNELLRGKDKTYERMINRMMKDRADLQRELVSSRRDIGTTNLTALDKESIQGSDYPSASARASAGSGTLDDDIIPLPPASVKTQSQPQPGSGKGHDHLISQPASDDQMFEILSMIDIALENGDSIENIRLSLLISGYEERSVETAFKRLGV